MRSQILRLALFAAVLMSVGRVHGIAKQAGRQTSKHSVAKAAAGPASAIQSPATLAQLMRGIMFPNSNVVFAAQGKGPANVPPAKDPSSAINPLEGPYGKWEAVENSSLAMVEAANLLIVPGRLCSNGKTVPTNSADWPRLVQGLRDASMMSYRAAQSKDKDKILDATDALTTACSNCHVKYRDKKLGDRCQ